MLLTWTCGAPLRGTDPEDPAVSRATVSSACLPAARHTLLRDGDELWLVSTRAQCGLPASGQPVSWSVWRWSDQRWEPSDVQHLRQAVADQPRPMLVFIHGNRVDAALAGQYGYQAYDTLVASVADLPPVRAIVWSWPSDQLHGPIRDARTKAERSDLDAWLLATFLAELPWPAETHPTVGIVGYSLGARIACGSVHLLAGGRWQDQELDTRPALSLRLALWAAAEHSHWLLPGQPHGQALAAAECCWVAVNPCDPALSRYRWVDRCERPAALGVVGVCGNPQLPADVAARVREENVANQIGKSHTLHPYLRSRYILERTRDCLFGKPQSPALTDTLEAPDARRQ